MRLPILQAMAIVATWFLASSSQGDNLTYPVNPVNLSNGYAVSGGFITTDGTLGPLAVSNILDFEFVVSGPYPYTFTHSSPVAVDVFIEGQVEASSKEIFLPPDLLDPIGVRNRLSVFVDLDGDKAYENGITYFSGTFVDLDDETISSLTLIQIGISTPEGTKGAFWRVDPSTRLSIATIPEPATILLGSLVACLAGITRRR